MTWNEGSHENTIHSTGYLRTDGVRSRGLEIRGRRVRISDGTGRTVAQGSPRVIRPPATASRVVCTACGLAELLFRCVLSRKPGEGFPTCRLSSRRFPVLLSVWLGFAQFTMLKPIYKPRGNRISFAGLGRNQKTREITRVRDARGQGNRLWSNCGPSLLWDSRETRSNTSTFRRRSRPRQPSAGRGRPRGRESPRSTRPTGT
jgi:hypothetical protein